MQNTSPAWIICIIITLTLVTPPSANANPPVSAANGSFVLCDQTFRFVGFNTRGICHYGRGDILPFSHYSDIIDSLDYCADADSRVIRTFCANHMINATETGDRLQTILDACDSRGIYVIVVLTDMYNTGFCPEGDRVYYTQTGWFYMLDHAFFSGGYTENYLPQAIYLADRFKDHPAVFAWQLGNEIRDIFSGSTFVAFCQNMSAQIRSVDPHHMINPGLIGWRQSSISYNQGLQIYGHMDFVGSHNYNGSDYDNDSDIASQLNLPYVIDEAGFDFDTYGPDRTPETNNDIGKWVGRGADGYLQWALMASSYDNGDGDYIFGVDPVFHFDDFYSYRSLFSTWGSAFEQPLSLQVEPAFIQRTVPFGGEADVDTFLIRNGGTGRLDFALTETVSWLSIEPLQGQTDCTGTTITMTYQTNMLAPGVHDTRIQVTAPDATNSPQFVEIELRIEGYPGDMDLDDDVDQTDFGLFQSCLTGPGIPQLDGNCALAHMDQDLDVDQDDFALFRKCISGPGITPDPNCLNG